MKEGKLPIYKAGKRYKFKISEVDTWLREGRISDDSADKDEPERTSDE